MSRRFSLSNTFKAQDFYRHYRHESKGYAKIRFLAMHHIQEGKSTVEVGQIVGYPRQTIWEWIRWFDSGGIERLSSSPTNRGRKSKLSKAQESELKDKIPQLQEQRSGGRINGEDIRKYIKDTWKVEYAPGSIYTVLRRIDLVWITSRSQHPHSDPEAQESFKK